MIFFTRPMSKRESAWLLIIAMLILVPPVGVLLLVRQLLTQEKPPALGRRNAAGTSQQTERPPLGARTTQCSAPACGGDANPALAALRSKSKRLVTLGTILTVLFAVASVGELANAAVQLASGNPSQCYQTLADATPILCFLGGGAGCLLAGLQKKQQVARYRKYLSMVGQRTSIPIQTLADAAGLPAKQVRHEVEDMLSQGIFPIGFLDRRANCLVLTREGLADHSAAEQAAKQADDAAQEDAILQQIQAVKQSIRNPRLSGQIDQVERLTAKILDYRKNHPESTPQLHSFLSYYLPTTLKILQAYSELEDQDVSGKNITAAMERIEGMMDKVVEGFETQLDLLFQGNTMDITAEVAVLEQMLIRDGLSDGRSLTRAR